MASHAYKPHGVITIITTMFCVNLVRKLRYNLYDGEGL